MTAELLLDQDPNIISQAVSSEGRPVAEAAIQIEEGLAIEPPVRREVPARRRIEEIGDEWAMGRMARTLGRRYVRPVRVARRKYQGIFDLPKLAEIDPDPWSPRVSLNGEIFIIRWDEPMVIEEGGVRILRDADEFDQIRRSGEHTIDLSGPLPPREIQEAIPMRNKTIEGAVRQALHITGEWAEEEFSQIAKAMGMVNSIVDQTLSQGLTRESITALAEQTAAGLEESGFFRARDTTKRDITKALISAPKLFGSKIPPRPNPLITRIYARSALLKAVRREAETILIGEKFSRIRGLLLMAREYDRAIIGGAMNDLDTFAGFTKRGPAVFMQEKPKVQRGEIEGMQQVLWAIATPLADANVAPYKSIARRTAINLVGCREKYRGLNREIIGEGADDLFGLPPVTALLEQGDFPEAKRRVIELSYNPLRDVLLLNQNIGQDLDVGPEETF